MEDRKNNNFNKKVGEKKAYNGAAKKSNSPNKENRGNARNDSFARSNAVVGRNAVAELLKAGTPVDKILVSGVEGSVKVIVAKAKEARIPIVDTTQEYLNRIAGGENHQGVVALVAEKEYCTVEDILNIAAERGEKPLIVVCDGIEDPHNLGAVIRCAECEGAHGIIIPERRACGLTPAVSKASAGAIMHMAVAKVPNLAQTIEKLKENGVWTYAAEADGQDFYDTDFSGGCAIVLGGEDTGVSRLVKERCDYTVSIPMYGKLNSLNVSTAASVLLCHAARMQRR
jgi:23S rRNA (guanosine2251-2'-O)-methyltransferase